MKREQVEINTPFIRLSGFLKFCGACETGGQAGELIKEGKALVNGEVCDMRGKKLFPGDTVTFENTLYEVVGVEG